MDSEHSKHLARILENRRKRGVSAAKGSTTNDAPKIMSPSPITTDNHLLISPQSSSQMTPQEQGNTMYVQPADTRGSRLGSPVPSQAVEAAGLRSASTGSSVVYFSPPQIIKSIQLSGNNRPLSVVNTGVAGDYTVTDDPPLLPTYIHTSSYQPSLSSPRGLSYGGSYTAQTHMTRVGTPYNNIPIEDRRGVSVNTMRPPYTYSNNTVANTQSDYGQRSFSAVADGLFAKGKFENFRMNPVLVSPNIRPYRSSSLPVLQQNVGALCSATEAHPNHGDDRIMIPIREASPPINLDVNPFSVQPNDQIINTNPIALISTMDNPFRRQSYEEFKINPQYLPPKDFISVSRLPAVSEPLFNRMKSIITGFGGDSQPKLAGDLCIHDDTPEDNLPSPKKAVRAAKGGAKGHVPHIFDLGKCLLTLSKGDWFLKWTRQGKVHKRFFRLQQNNSTLEWSSSPDSVVEIISRNSIHLADITGIQPQCIVDEESNRTVYKIHILTNGRFLHIGTEMRDKFDIWVDTLQRLSAAMQHDLKRSGLTLSNRQNRYSTMKIKPDVDIDRYLHRAGFGDE